MITARIELDEVVQLCLCPTQLARRPTNFLPEVEAIHTDNARRFPRRQSTVAIRDFRERLFRFRNTGVPVAK